MPSITIRNLPDDLHQWLKIKAEENQRSLNQEAIHCLEIVKNQSAPKIDVDAEVKAFRNTRSQFLTAEEIDAAIEEGRR